MKYTIRSKKNPKFYLERGYAEDEQEAQFFSNIFIKHLKEKKNLTVKEIVGEEKVHSLKSKNCSLRKENAIKIAGSLEQYRKNKIAAGSKGIKPTQLEYWLNRGLDLQKATYKLSEVQKKRSKRSKEYWLSRGFSEIETKEKISEYQDFVSKPVFIKKYGTKEGTKKYEEFVLKLKTSSKRSLEYWISLGFSNEKAKNKLSEHQDNNSKKSFIKRYGTKEGTKKYKKFSFKRKLTSKWSFLYWMSKGHSETEAKKIVSKIQTDFATRDRHFFESKKSKIEQRFFDFVSSKIQGCKQNETIQNMYPDILIGNLVIEINGDYWHCNPKQWKAKEKNTSLGLLAEEKWKNDEKRVQKIKDAGYKMMVIWESDLNRNGYDFYLSEIKKTIQT